jgi:hypothetical protein
MKLAGSTVAALSLLLGGCSGMSGLSTGSIFGGSSESKTTTAASSAPTNDPTARAFQVGTVSARAVKCGYNFDPGKLRASYLAHEIGQGASSADMARIEKIYDVAFNGVTKAVASEPNYCTDARTTEIKAALNRHLAGDYTPNQPKAVAQNNDGLFSGWFDSSSTDSGPSFGSSDWWDKQQEKVGR